MIFAAALLLLSCNPSVPIPQGRSITFTETNEQMANPERGLYVQTYYTTANLEDTVALQTVISNRERSQITLYLHSYYLADTVTGCPSYIESDIDPVFLERFDRNMRTLREGGAKAILRFSYKYTRSIFKQPWDATPEWAMKHIAQLEPYFQKNADVIYCVQAGFIGVWGEWFYTTSYPSDPVKDEGYETRWPVAERLLQAVPADRQVCFRQPQFKIRYLRTHGMEVAPLTASEAYQPTIKARWAGHNDCFVSSENDVGTYQDDNGGREFWAEDTKYTLMGGETCKQCEYSNGANAVKEMEKYHWSYLCNSYHPDILADWVSDGHYQEIKRRLGYRLALDRAVLTENPVAGQKFDAFFVLHNSGFAAPVNKRDVELIFVSVSNPNEKYVYPQQEDPRFWMPDNTLTFSLPCTLDKAMHGQYKLYLNLPDPYPSLHDDPRYSIRLANENVWEEETGYNYIADITVSAE